MALLKFMVRLFITNFKSALALRGTFVMQMLFMIMNNLIFFCVWWILFQRFDDIEGWRFDDIKILYGLAAASWGLSVIFGQGSHELADKILNGSLDSYLIQPKSTLIHLTGSKTSPAGWGDLVTTLVLFTWAGAFTLEKLPLLMLLCVSGACIMLAVKIMAHSLVFWLGHTEGFHTQIYESLLLFSTYPDGLFHNWIKIFLFTIVPAGFMTYLPVSLVNSFSWGTLSICLVAALGYLLLARFMFRRGLKRYESGNLMMTQS